MRLNVPISVGGRFFTRWDVVAVLLILGVLAFLGEASRHLLQPLAELQRQPVSLDPANLPGYAARTTLRMLIAMAMSLLFTFTYATLAAKNRNAERLLIPLLDILQSVPILGFISITVVLPTLITSEATTKNQLPDIDIIMFQMSCGIANGTSSRQNRIRGDRRNTRDASMSSTGTVRSDW